MTIPAAPRLDLDRLLDAIRAVEGWDGHSVGLAGEYGPWQMLPSVWRQYAPHTDIRKGNPESWRLIARMHLTAIIAAIEHKHHGATPFNCGLAWNGGSGLVGRKYVPQDKFEYAERVETLYVTQ